MSAALSNGEFLGVRLQRLDLLLHREVLRLRARYQLSLDEFRGLYISDDQIDCLIDQQQGYEGDCSIAEELITQAEALRDAEEQDENDAWRKLADEFALSDFEQDILLLALAPEFDLKYETFYGYLNNDVTRKWPTHDLALRVFARNQQDKTQLRVALASTSTLFSGGLLQPTSASQVHVSSLARGFSVTPALLHYLLGHPDCDLLPPIPSTSDVPEQQTLQDLTARQREVVDAVINLLLQRRTFPLIVLSGREGIGRRTTADAICRALGIPLKSLDLVSLRSSTDGSDALRSVLLDQRLRSAALYVERPDAFFDEQGREFPNTRQVLQAFSQSRHPIFIAWNPNLNWRELFMNRRVVAFEFDDPDHEARLNLWQTALDQFQLTTDPHTIATVAERFVLTPAQITCAARSASDQKAFESTLDSNSEEGLLFAAARSQSDQSLGKLASKIESIHGWDDLILPRQTLQRVLEIAAAVRNRHVVYSDWGFEKRISSGKGLKALFAGSSGTGKTMSAGIIARELGLDLYKIDLSGIVSKYIGETEKNLDRVFQAAKSSNAILFFDEADALFGKRSEVKDAHDRYANIEVAYLLQKVEDYDGVVVLASNLSKNIDEAFSRRMHYVIEFPLPDENERELLWCKMFPPELPLGNDVDFRFLAKKFPIAGGDIRNVSLDAAFMAAGDGKVVTMKQLARALARQMTKQGKIPSAMEFQQYHTLLSEAFEKGSGWESH